MTIITPWLASSITYHHVNLATLDRTYARHVNMRHTTRRDIGVTLRMELLAVLGVLDLSRSI